MALLLYLAKPCRCPKYGSFAEVNNSYNTQARIFLKPEGVLCSDSYDIDIKLAVLND